MTSRALTPSRKLRCCSALALISTLAACDPADPALDLGSVHVDHVQQARAYIDQARVWPSADGLVVCWRRGYEDREEELLWVRTAIRDTWERAANVRFVGWRPCSQTRRPIAFPIDVIDEGPYVLGLGSSIARMVLNFDFQEWGCNGSPCRFNKATRKRIIQSIAVHEFGHALGLSHEHNRPDTPSSCREEPQGPNGDRSFGEWDSLSVMNYCNPNVDTRLSRTDINAAQFMYGARSAFAFDRNDFRAPFGPATANRFDLRDLPQAGQWQSADLNADGVQELVALEVPKNQETLVVRSYEATAWSNAPARRTLATNGETNWVLSDLDADRRADLVSMQDLGWATFVRSYHNEGNGTFASAKRVSILFRQSETATLLLGDVTGDQQSELVQIEPNSRGARVRTRVAKNGQFVNRRAMSRLRYLYQGPLSWHLGDVNGDGRQDLIRVHKTRNAAQFCVHRANADGTFASQAPCTSDTRVQAPSQEVVLDLDGDGRSDLMRVFGASDQVRLAPVLSNGTQLETSNRLLDSSVAHWEGQSWLAVDKAGDAGASLLGLW